MLKSLQICILALLCLCALPAMSQGDSTSATPQTTTQQQPITAEQAEDDSLDVALDEAVQQDADSLVAPMESGGLHQSLKTKFIEGNAGFMSLVALALVIGLAFCIERIIYLSLSEIKTKLRHIEHILEDEHLRELYKKRKKTHRTREVSHA